MNFGGELPEPWTGVNGNGGNTVLGKNYLTAREIMLMELQEFNTLSLRFLQIENSGVAK